MREPVKERKEQKSSFYQNHLSIGLYNNQLSGLLKGANIDRGNHLPRGTRNISA